VQNPVFSISRQSCPRFTSPRVHCDSFQNFGPVLVRKCINYKGTVGQLSDLVHTSLHSTYDQSDSRLIHREQWVRRLSDWSCVGCYDVCTKSDKSDPVGRQIWTANVAIYHRQCHTLRPNAELRDTIVRLYCIKGFTGLGIYDCGSFC